MKKNTVCRLCSSCCPVEVEVENDRLIAAERRSPLPPGERWPCVKLQAAEEIVYAPDRLKKPLIRKEGGARGEFREASWDEALDLVAERFRHFKENHGAQSVCWLRGMAADWGAPWDYANRLMNAFGSPNTIGNGSVCHVARDMAHVYTYGAMTLPQIKASRCILVWGKSDPDTNPTAAEAILCRPKAGRQTDRRRSHPDQTGLDGRHLAAGQTGTRRPPGHGHDPRDHRGRSVTMPISSGNGPSDSTN